MRNYIMLFAALICMTSNPVYAQFNLSVGYDLGYTVADVHNEVLSSQNAKSEYSEGFKDLHLLHGVALGGRYAFENVALEINLSTKLATREASDPAFSLLSEVKNRLKYGFYSASIGVEGHTGFFGLGGSIDYHLMRVKANFEEPSFIQKFNHNTFGNKIFMTFYFGGNGATKLAIRPFAQFYWDPWNQGRIDQVLNKTDYSPTAEKFNHFGLSFIFFNGN